ncbi:hypothetical protein A6M21_06370 [Desulfotomaculum copahuensis]|uniref:Uncharacterized protein n=1 Tax=Desulfotomaculum copahuensis TaxID=1838280 RepID=A0A1B7LH57_9FIRM|nr:hypothetical protein A6M21_06370 [Desulfotomaculum copahuensis]
MAPEIFPARPRSVFIDIVGLRSGRFAATQTANCSAYMTQRAKAQDTDPVRDGGRYSAACAGTGVNPKDG